MFEVYVEEMEGLFRHLDYQNTGKIKKDELFFAIGKLEQVESELKLPSAAELEDITQNVDQKERDYYTYEEYLNILVNMCNEVDSSDED